MEDQSNQQQHDNQQSQPSIGEDEHSQLGDGNSHKTGRSENQLANNSNSDNLTPSTRSQLSSPTIGAASSPNEEVEEIEDDEYRYEKTLRSDVTADLSFKLLKDIASKDSAYEHFSVSDLKNLSNVLSVLSVARDDTIIQRGEEATFCGIVLDGCFEAIVSPTIRVELRRGTLLGEQALFEGGLRNADVRCSQDAVLAVITYQELSELGTTYPILQRHLYVLFACASIKKLRKMTLTPAQLSELAKKEEEDAAAAAAAASSAPSSAEASTVAQSGVSKGEAPSKRATPTSSTKKKEFLYRQRIERQQQQQQQTTDLKSAEKLATEEMEKEKAKRAKVEKAAKTDRIRLENALRKIEKYSQLLDRSEEQLEAAQHELNKKDARMSQLEKQRDEAVNNLSKVQAQCDTAQSGRAAAESKLSTLQETLTREYEMKYEPQLSAARNELARLRAELETNNQHEKKTTEEHLKLLEVNKQLQESIANITNIRNTLYTELFEEKKRRESHELALIDREKQLSEYKFNSRHLELRLVELEERIASLGPWKVKCLEMQQQMDQEKKACARSIEEAHRGKTDLEDDIQRYQKILKLVVVGTFCRESRLRRALARSHEHVSEMLLTSLEENMISGTGGGVIYPASQAGLSTASTSISSASAIAKQPRTSFKAIRKRKKAYLMTLLKSKSRPAELVASLDEEVQKLKAPLEEILDKIRHWRMTSESFFQRTVELTGEKEELEAAFRKTVSKIEHVKHLLRAGQQDHEELMNKNSELLKQNHAYKTEIDRLQAKYGVMATNAASLGADKPDGNNSAGAATGADGKNKKNAKTNNAIESLQVRQHDLLQENIARLQSHYEYLLQQVQSLNPAVGVGIVPKPDGTLHSYSSQASLSTGVVVPITAADEKQQHTNPNESRSHNWMAQSQSQSQFLPNPPPVHPLSQTSSQASLHSVPSSHTMGTMSARPSPPSSQTSAARTTIAYPSTLRPVHTMHPMPGAPYYSPSTTQQPGSLPMAPQSMTGSPSTTAAAKAFADHHRQLYEQAIGKRYNSIPPVPHFSPSQDQQIQRIESALFHLPTVPSSPSSHPTPSQSQSQSQSRTPRPTPSKSKPPFLQPYKSGSQSSRGTRS